MDDDDDMPPPLSGLADQVQALAGVPRRNDEEVDHEFLPIATTTIVGVKTECKATVIKRGFFDAKPKAKPKQVTPKVDDGITVLTGKKNMLSNDGRSIPEFMRIEPDEQTKRMQEVKGKLVTALTPTAGMIDKINQNPVLMSAFQDVEVMAAVDEIAKDPSKMKKHKDNKKVQEFYKAMAAFAGNSLEQMENKPL